MPAAAGPVLAALLGLVGGSDSTWGAPPPVETAAAVPVTLILKVSGLRSASGKLLVAMYRSAEGFPGDPKHAAVTRIASVAAVTAEVRIADVPAGRYAIAVVHDEDGNEQLDTYWFGLPKEGVAVSGKKVSRIGPPKFPDSVVEVPVGETAISLTMSYL